MRRTYCRSDDQPLLRLRPDKEDGAQHSPAGAGFVKPSLFDDFVKSHEIDDKVKSSYARRVTGLLS
jgi:hypothetical protein